MSPTMPNRLPDKSGIPRGFIRNWQYSKNQGAKPLVRRPTTACEACRTAKVKCNARKDCQRCSNRGIKCVYTAPSLSSDANIQHQGASPKKSMPSSASAISQDIPTDLEIDGTGISFPDNMELDLGDSAVWPQEMAEQLPWVIPDANIEVSEIVKKTHHKLFNSNILTRIRLFIQQHIWIQRTGTSLNRLRHTRIISTQFQQLRNPTMVFTIAKLEMLPLTVPQIITHR